MAGLRHSDRSSGGSVMLKRRRWIAPLAIALALVGVSLAAVALFYPRERLLIERAAPLADTSHWEDAGHYWLPDQALLLLRYFPLGNGSNTYSASRYDLASHQETPLPGLTAALSKAAYFPDMIQVSPDGKWLRWTDFPSAPVGEDAFVQKVIVASLDGQHREEWHLKDANNYFWLSDSRHWIAVHSIGESQKNRARIYSLDDPRRVQSLKIDPTMPDLYDRWMSVSNDTMLLDTGSWTVQSASDEIIALQIDLHSIQSRSRTKVALPPNAEIIDILYSPQGDRIAWVLNLHSTPVFAAFLRRLLPSFSAPPQTALSLWVSRADGSEMHEIGHLQRQIEIDVPKIPVATTGPAPSTNPVGKIPQVFLSDSENPKTDTTAEGWQWMPDGKRISFIQKSTLYSVSVE
jgi:hypothetical protein